jgi:uncharacterized protein (TIGR00255 family)
MIRSMTGFGQGAAEVRGGRVVVVLRSVNNRFADFRLKLPSEMAAREAELRGLCKRVIRRGRLELSMSFERPPEVDSAQVLNRPHVEAALSAVKSLRDDYAIEGSLDLRTLLLFPGITQPPGREPNVGDDEQEAVERALTLALEAIDRERVREGEALRVDVLSRVERMSSVVGELEKRARDNPAQIRDKLLERISTLTEGVDVDPSRMAQEVAFLVDRSDFTEELVRLRAHLEQMHALLDTPDGEPVGKRLDFLVQEVHRETNTVGSKSSDLGCSRLALDLKAEVEKIREQVQNLE